MNMAYKCKYYKQQKQVSYDNGETWSNLNEFRMGTLYEPNSRDCDPTMTLYRWVVYGDTFCVDGVEMQRYMKQVSYDNGETWATVLPMETQVQATGVSCAIYRWVATSDVVCLENHDNFEVKMVSANTPVSFSEYSSYYIVNTHLGGGDVTKTYTISVKTSKYDHFYVDYALTASEYYQGFAVLDIYADGNLILRKTTNSPTTVGKGIIAYPNDEIDEHEILFVAASQGKGHYLEYLTIYKPETSIEFDNYYLYKKQVSDNGGITWEDVTPSELTPSGNSLGDYSESSCTVPYDSFDATCTKIQLSSENGAVKYLKNDGLPLNNNEVSYCCVANPNSNLHYAVTNVEIGNCVRVIEEGAFGVLNQPWSFETFVIPEGVTTIKSAAFPWNHVRAPYHYSFPSTLNYLSNGTQYASISAFRLLAMTFNGTTPPATLNINIHDDNLESIYVPCESINLYKAAVGSGYASRVKCLSEHPILYDYVDGYKKVSYNDGNTWHDFWPITYVGNFRFTASYSDGTTASAACNSTSAITSGEINLTSLVSVEIGQCVTEIAKSALSGCTSLTSCTIPNSVTSIGDNAFYKCTSLTSIDIPSGVTSISDRTFEGCSGLTSITIPDSVTSIGDYAFLNCSSLTSCTIGSGVTSIGDGAFNRCSGLTSIDMPNSVTSIGDTAFIYCTSLTSCTIGSGVTSIGAMAFESCKSLTSVVIPDSVSTIGGEAFAICSGLTKVIVNATTPPTLKKLAGSYNTFYNTNNCPIYVPCESVAAYKAASGWSNYATRIHGIPPCVEPPFEGKFKLTLSDSSVVSAECDSTSAITSSETIAYLADCVAIEIGSCVTRIGSEAFYHCTSLTFCTIGSGVTSIGYSAFRFCAGLTNIEIPDNVKTIGTYVFTDCTSLTSCTIGSGVTTIGDSAFASCSNLTSIEIPDNVKTISEYAFNDCTSLTSVVIGSGVTSIGRRTFNDCRRLTYLTLFANTPPSLGSDVLYGTNITIIYVPSGSVNAYKSASGWSSYASIIQAIPT